MTKQTKIQILSALAIIASFAYFPQSYERVLDGWSDFSIYLRGTADKDWLYPHYVSYLFEPFRALPTEGMSFAVFYSAGVLVWLYIIRRSVVLGVLAAYPILLGLEAGNLTPTLAFLCLFPSGAVLASLVKPYLLVFVVGHAVLLYRKHHHRTGEFVPWCDRKKAELDLSDDDGLGV